MTAEVEEMGKKPGDFQRAAPTADGHRAKEEGPLPGGRSTGKTPFQPVIHH